MKAFVVVCSCPAEHDQSNTQCPVEKMIYLITAYGLKDEIHDVLDIQPVFDHKDVKP